MSKGSKRRPGDNNAFGKTHERIFGKRTAKSFQKGRRFRNGVVQRVHDNENMDISLSSGCLPSQVAQNNADYGHLGVRWDKHGNCKAKDSKALQAYMEASGRFLKNDIKGGPGASRRRLEKDGLIDEQFLAWEKPPEPKPKRPKTGMSEDEAHRILYRVGKKQRLTG